MKTRKLFLLAGTLFLSMNSYGQFGVNTLTPAATLDVVASNETGTSTGVDGVLFARVDRQRAQSMKGIPVSTLIYVNNIATGTATGIAVNIDSTGFYYFDGKVWVKFHDKNSGTGFIIYKAPLSPFNSYAGNTLKAGDFEFKVYGWGYVGTSYPGIHFQIRYTGTGKRGYIAHNTVYFGNSAVTSPSVTFGKYSFLGSSFMDIAGVPAFTYSMNNDNSPIVGLFRIYDPFTQKTYKFEVGLFGFGSGVVSGAVPEVPKKDYISLSCEVF